MGRLKPSRITLYMIAAFLLLSLFGITVLQQAIATDAVDNEAPREQISRLEQENLELEHRIDALGTDASAEELARERLHWVYDQEVVYINAGQ